MLATNARAAVPSQLTHSEPSLDLCREVLKRGLHGRHLALGAGDLHREPLQAAQDAAQRLIIGFLAVLEDAHALEEDGLARMDGA